jgi:curved DNA-binding protein CbpA
MLLEQILEIDMDAKQDEIKTAYIGLAKKNHPDQGGSSEKFQEITRAYEILYNKETRKEYDLYYLKKSMDEFKGDDILRLKDEYKKSEDFPSSESIQSGDESIVRVVHVASLFDLVTLESAMIKKDNLTNPNANTFEELVNTSGLRGLNTLAKGVSAALAGAKSAGEIIAAAFFYLTEDDNAIINARDETMPNADTILSKTNNNYIEATKLLFEQFNLDRRYATDSQGFKELLTNFYKKVGGRFTKGLQLDDSGLVDIGKKFGNPELKVFFNYVDINEQVVKGIFFKFAMSEDSIVLIDIKVLAKKAEAIQNQNISKSAMVQLISKIYIERAKLLAKERKQSAKLKQPPLDTIKKGIEKNLSVLPIKIELGKEAFFAERPLLQEKAMIKAGNLDYISDNDMFLLEQLISSFSLEYFRILGYLPTPSEISGIIGYFAASNIKNVSNRLQDTGLTKLQADNLAKQMTITSQWTKK